MTIDMQSALIGIFLLYFSVDLIDSHIFFPKEKDSRAFFGKSIMILLVKQ